MFDLVFGQFRSMPYPTKDCTDQTVIVTGSNTGIGLETARHFVRLNAARVILACRSTAKGEAAKASIEASTPSRLAVIEVWLLDMASFESVREFAKRASQLNRLDVLICNASVAPAGKTLVEGYEEMITVNVLSTFLIVFMLLPTLRATGKQFNITPRLVVVASDAAGFVSFFPLDLLPCLD
jgi:retinol dehydrogenase 12